MRLKQYNEQQPPINIEQQHFYDTLFLTNPDLAFLPSALEGQVSGQQNREVNQTHGIRSSSFLEKIIQSGAKAYAGDVYPGRNLLLYGWGVGYDADFVSTAIAHQLYVEVRDISPVSCAFAERYMRAFLAGTPTSYKPSVYHDDLRNFELLEHHETIAILYLGRVLGLLELHEQCDILVKIGQALFSHDQPSHLVVVQSFKDDNKTVDQHRMKLMKIDEMLRTLERGAGRKLQVCEQDSWPYYYKTVRALAITA